MLGLHRSVTDGTLDDPAAAGRLQIPAPGLEYTTRSHMTSHDVVYATARADLFRLADLSPLERQKRGRKLNVFRVPPDLEARIRGLRSGL